MKKVQIKICGLTEPLEAEFLNANGVNYAGVVLFYPKSKRNTTLEHAREILRALAPSVQPVAVMVAPSLKQLDAAYEAGFDYVQFHGSIAGEVIAQSPIPLLKGFNLQDMDRFEEYRRNPKIVGYVFDAGVPGSGKTFDWTLLSTLPRDEKLFFLAGGLNPDNVRAAVDTVQPDGVDVSTGVEYSDRAGKDPAKIACFVRNAREGV